MLPACCHDAGWMVALPDRTRAFDPDRVVVIPQRSEARECASGKVRELVSGGGPDAAAQRNGADQAPLLPALELFFRNQFSGSHRALSLTESSTTEEVRPGRLELPPGIRRTRPSTLRVYQFRHRRVDVASIDRSSRPALEVSFRPRPG
jgi:hypothetical protein